MTQENHPGVPSHWALSILRFLEHHAAQGRTPLALAGLPEDFLSRPPERINVGVERGLLEKAILLTGDDLAAARIGLGVDSSRTSLLAYLLLNSRTLEDSLANAVRYARVERPRSIVACHDEPDGVFLQIDTTASHGRLHAHHLEFVLCAVTAALRSAVGSSTVPKEVRFAHKRAPAVEARLAELLEVPVRCGCPAPGLVLDRDMLDLPVVGADNQLLLHLSRLADIALARSATDPAAFSTRVDKAIVRRLPSGCATQARIAADLEVTPRTLSRQLQGEGSSFGEILAALRHRLADEYLADPDLSLAEIAYLLGYSDQSNFTTAYKRWTGRSPGQARSGRRQGV